MSAYISLNIPQSLFMIRFQPAFWGFDMRRGMNVSRDTIGQYTTTLLDNEAVKLVKQHDKSKPMFLMVAHAAPHAGNPSIPLQAPDDVVEIFDNEFIPDRRRQKYAGFIQSLWPTTKDFQSN